ncbi:GNAT family N-acetyltransferase [Kineococcus sp. NPDC059986]|uniref:GNAT family N-acetyltransferase n=1 Tax=Kineococcus sp. NPDC059986 TaxID=3155538 RepID=UPI00344FB488
MCRRRGECSFAVIPRQAPARGHGYALEAVVALLGVAADEGLSRVCADTTLDNVASQRTLARAGFEVLRTVDDVLYYEARLGVGRSRL